MGKILKALEKSKIRKESSNQVNNSGLKTNSMQTQLNASKKIMAQEASKEKIKEDFASEQNIEPSPNAKTNIGAFFSESQTQDTKYNLAPNNNKNNIANDRYDKTNKKNIQQATECIIDKAEIKEKLLNLRKECSKHTFKKISSRKKLFSKKRRKDLITLIKPNSIISEHFQVAKTLVSNLIREKQLKTILVTSSLPLEGKSFIASNLAVSIARGLDEHVLLIDTDLNKPSIHKIFKINSEKGLSDFLVNDHHELSDFIKKTTIAKLSILPAGSCFEQSTELLASEMMKLFIQDVKHRYDDRFVIFDSSPIISSQSLAIANKVDGTIIVVKAGKTDRKLIKKAVGIIGKERILGIIMNNCSVSFRQYKNY